jgi:Uma2 family endonuclease
MVRATQQNLYTFEEYIIYDDQTDNHYELVDGRLETMTPPTFLHILICDLIRDTLKAEIESLQLPLIATRESGIRTGFNKSRIADVSVLTKEQVLNSLERSGICDTPPVLIVEVVSFDSIKRDYRFKRSEYAASGVGEYWIVDPLDQKVTVLVLNEGLYEDNVYTENQIIASPTFEGIKLTVEQVLRFEDI